MRRWIVLAILAILGVVPAQAATRLVVPSGGAGSGTCISTACTLTYALTQAVAGDTVTLADGTYSGEFTINGANGTSGSKITIQAANKHQAIFQGNNACDRNQEGLVANRAWWVIKDLKFIDHGRAISIFAADVEVSNVIIDHFQDEGIRAENTARPYIHDSVITNGVACGLTQDSPGILSHITDTGRIEDNIIMATGTNSDQLGPLGGYGVQIVNNSDAWTIKGNLLLANQGKGVLRILVGPPYTSANNHIVRDNAFLFGEGNLATDNCSDDSNQFINNIMYGLYFWGWYTKGNVDGTKGHHTLDHNLFYLSPFSRSGVGFITTPDAPCNTPQFKIDNIFKNNLMYSEYDTNQPHVLIDNDGGSQSFAAGQKHHNLIWAPGTTADWVDAYTYDATDIHATGSQPIFTNPSTGNFSLQTGSPGKNAASDGSDIGIAYNSFLKLSWLNNAFALPTVEHAGLTGATSDSFTGLSPTNYYQVWFYIPNSPCSSSSQQFTIEGVGGSQLVRNINSLNTSTWVSPGGPQRWITLGRHLPADGTLNVSWPTANCVERLFIRKIPTSAEAYTWIAAPAAPTNLRVVEP